jgi:hypothetical protein
MNSPTLTSMAAHLKILIVNLSPQFQSELETAIKITGFIRATGQITHVSSTPSSPAAPHATLSGLLARILEGEDTGKLVLQIE